MSVLEKHNDLSLINKMPLFTNIQHFSLQDGPGIRTTVFVKGCPLRCPWCHNPETQSPKVEINYFIDKCIGCARCVEICPTGATHVEYHNEDAFIRFDRNKCSGCGRCVDVCLEGARERVGNNLTLDEVVREATADILFFIKSGGGVTISGGEPLFSRNLQLNLQRSSSRNIYMWLLKPLRFANGIILMN